MTFKPLLASPAPENLSTLRFPVLASPKLDGIRCVKLGGRALSRNLKPIPNEFARAWIERWLPDGIDGELMLRDHRIPFCDVTSAIMSRDGEPDFVFSAFDLLPEDGHDLQQAEDVPFMTRLGNLHRWARKDAAVYGQATYRLRVVPHDEVQSLETLREIIAEHATEGYEGTMLRDPNGRYKFGRSTTKEGILLKVKAFADEEATVIGVEEEMENQNEATKDNLGRTKRSTAQAGKVGKGRLGALHCRTKDGAEFSVGSGFTEQQRIELWAPFIEAAKHVTLQSGRRPTVIVMGESIFPPVKFKHQPPPGGRKPGEAPRFPVFLGFRHEADA